MKKTHLNITDWDATQTLSSYQWKAISGGNTGRSDCISGYERKSVGDTYSNPKDKSKTCKMVPISFKLVCRSSFKQLLS